VADTSALQGEFDPFEQHVVAGSELLRQSRIKDAQTQLLQALELKPDNSKVLALLGLAFFRGGQFAEAMPIYRALVAQAPHDASYRLNLGLVHLKLGDADSAINELMKCRELDPSQSRAVGYLGLACARAGRYSEAYQAFLQAGQDDLAQEIVHHLTDQERMAIEASIKSPPGAELSQPVIQIVEKAEPPPPPLPPSVSRPVEIVPAQQVDDAQVVEAQPDQGAISRAVAQAAPSAAAATIGTRVAPGSRPPQPLSEFATSRLVRPEDGDQPFEISAGGVLIVRVEGRMFARTEGVDVTGGDLTYEPATRRIRGAQTQEPFASGERALYIVSGRGVMIASPLGGEFTAVQLDDDIFYLREDVVFAFEPSVRWENGHVPGSHARIPMVQFRGSGAVAFRTPRPLLAVKLAPDRVLYIDANALAGWIGRVVPRAVSPQGTSRLSELFVECTGEGVVLVQEEQGTNLAVPVQSAEEAGAAPTDEP
jgi:tetratricopeptide (TPR) repeat protein